MTFSDVIKKSVLEGFASADMPTSKIITILLITFMIGIYIFFIYRLVNKSALYDRSFHVAMSIISVITAGIIIAMQSSIVISLGMVGALSIVRFRTAVKDTMDLLFLFWSIGEGIICGAGLFDIGIVVALIVTFGIFFLEYLPASRKPYLLIVNASSIEQEEEIINSINAHSKSAKIKSRNIKKTGFDIILEVFSKEERALVGDLNTIAGVYGISLLTHEGEVRF